MTAFDKAVKFLLEPLFKELKIAIESKDLEKVKEILSIQVTSLESYDPKEKR